MAMTGVLRPGFIQLRVLDLEQAVTHYADHLGLIEVCRGEDGRVYLKTYDEFDHHSVVLREATTAGMDMFAFKVDSEVSLSAFEQRIRDWGLDTAEMPAGEQPGLGRRIWFTIPSGHRIELYADMELAERRPDTHNPDIWTEEPHGMRAVRFDHCLLYGPNIEEVLRFFEEVLDFSCAERIDLEDGLLAIWLTVSTKPHDIAFVNHEKPGKFHHAGFFLESWTDVGHAADLMVHHDINIDIGPTRHGVTRGQTIYFFDPSGNRNEVYSGGYTYYPDNPTRTWDGSEIGKGIFYYEGELNEAFLAVVT